MNFYQNFSSDEEITAFRKERISFLKEKFQEKIWVEKTDIKFVVLHMIPGKFYDSFLPNAYVYHVNNEINFSKLFPGFLNYPDCIVPNVEGIYAINRPCNFYAQFFNNCISEYAIGITDEFISKYHSIHKFQYDDMFDLFHSHIREYIQYVAKHKHISSVKACISVVGAKDLSCWGKDYNRTFIDRNEILCRPVSFQHANEFTQDFNNQAFNKLYLEYALSLSVKDTDKVRKAMEEIRNQNKLSSL